MSDWWQDDLLGGTVATELVCKDHAGLASGGSQELRERKLPGVSGNGTQLCDQHRCQEWLTPPISLPPAIYALFGHPLHSYFFVPGSLPVLLFTCRKGPFAEPFLLLSTA